MAGLFREEDMEEHEWMEGITTPELWPRLQALERSLEDAPNTWFDQPSGWLLKPNFKRVEQKRAAWDQLAPLTSLGRSGAVASLTTKAAYTKRYFRVDDGKDGKPALHYYKSPTDGTPAGSIRLSEIITITLSRVADAPPHALDLVGTSQVYTLAAESLADATRWVLVIASLAYESAAGDGGRPSAVERATMLDEGGAFGGGGARRTSVMARRSTMALRRTSAFPIKEDAAPVQWLSFEHTFHDVCVQLL